MANIRYWDDLVPGETHDLGTFLVDVDDGLAFAHAFAPALAAQQVASPMFLVSKLMRQIVDAYLGEAAGLGAASVDKVTWRPDVALGTRLTVTLEVVETRELQSRPGVGYSKLRQSVRAPDGTVVLSWLANQFMRLRSAEAPPATTTQPRIMGRPLEPAATDWPLGAHTFSAEEIVAFATRFDPQRFHLSEAGARDSLFGMLCASGWHTCSVWMRMASEALDRQRSMEAFGLNGSPSDQHIVALETVSWKKPNYVGDTVRYFARPSDQSQSLSCFGIDQNNAHAFDVVARLSS